MKDILISVDEETHKYFAGLFSIHQEQGGRMLYTDYVGQLVSKLVTGLVKC